MTRLNSTGPFFHSLGGNTLSETQLRIDASLESFSEHACDLHSVSTFAVAGIIGQTGRAAFLGTGILQSHFLRPLLGHGAGLVSEAFTLSLLEHNPEAPFLKSFRSQLLNLGMLRLSGILFHTSNSFLRHSFSNFGMMAGHHLATTLGWESAHPQSLLEEFLNYELMNLQFEIGNELGQRISGHRLSRLQRHIEAHHIPLQTNLHLIDPILEFSSDATVRQDSGRKNIKYHTHLS